VRWVVPALLACTFALCAPSATAAEPEAAAAARCSGSVSQQIGGSTIRATSIKTRNVSCSTGKRVLRRFLRRAASSNSCRRAANQPPPTRGCVVSGYHCFRKRRPSYCATVSGRIVQWLERRVTRAR
jgi:hypothetical protein